MSNIKGGTRSPIRGVANVIKSPIRALTGLLAFLPSMVSGLRQYALGSSPHYGAPLAGRQVLAPKETSGSYRAPRQGRAYLFDGADDQALLGSRLIPGTEANFSGMVWVNRLNTPNNAVIMGEFIDSGQDYYRWSLSVSGVSANAYQLNLYSTGSNPNYHYSYWYTPAVAVGAWRHLAFTVNGTAIKFYIDGAEVALVKTDYANTWNGSFQDYSQSHFRLGGEMYIAPNSYMRDVRIYSGVKSAAEIAAIAAGDAAAPDKTNLLAGYHCNEESGLVAMDWSGNGKHLRLTNVTQSTFHAARSDVASNPANVSGNTLATSFTSNAASSWDAGSTWVSSYRMVGDFEIRFRLLTQATSSLAEGGMVGCQAESASGGNSYTLFDVGLQNYDALTRVWVNGASVDLAAASVRGSVYTLRRVGSTISIFIDGVLLTTRENSAPMYAAVSFTNTRIPVYAVEYLNGRDVDVGIKGSSVIRGSIVYPESATAAGSTIWGQALQSPGQTPYPVAPLAPAIYTSPAGAYVSTPWTPTALTAFTIFRRAKYLSSNTTYNLDGVYADNGVDCLRLGRNYPGATSGLYINYKNAAYSVAVGGGIANDVWNTIALAVESGGTADVYVDNVQWDSRAAGTFSISADKPFAVGASNDLGSLKDHRSDAIYGEYFIFNRKLSSDELLWLETGGGSGTDPTATGLVLWYPMQEGDGRTVYDASGNGRHGSVVGGTLSAVRGSRSGLVRDMGIAYGGRLAGDNFLLHSESAENPAWSTYQSTVTGNVTADPAGGSGGDLLTVNDAGGYLQQQTGMSVTAGPMAVMCYVKRGSVGFVRLSIYDGAHRQAWFNLDTVAVVQVDAGVTAAITDVGGGWLRIETRYSVPAGSPYWSLFPTTAAGNTAASGTVYVWGMQMGRPGQVYQKTTTAIKHGGFVPCIPGGDVCADGTTRDRGPGTRANPHTRLELNPFSAAELTALKLPASYPDLPCVTGDGSAVYADLGSPLIPSTADFSVSVAYKHKTTVGEGQVIIDQRTASADAFFFGVTNGSTGGGDKLCVAIGSVIARVPTILTDGQWYNVTCSRVGSTISITVDGVGTASATTAQAIAPARNTYLGKVFQSDYEGHYFNQSFADLRITAGGLTKYFPLSDGIGAGSNRDLGWYGSDGSSGVIAGALIGGTPASIWANLTSVPVVPGPYSMRGIVPRDTKFAREADGGTDRLLTYSAAPSGAALANVINFTS